MVTTSALAVQGTEKSFTGIDWRHCLAASRILKGRSQSAGSSNGASGRRNNTPAVLRANLHAVICCALIKRGRPPSFASARAAMCTRGERASERRKRARLGAEWILIANLAAPVCVRAKERERANRKNRSSLTAVNATGEMRKKQIASTALSLLLWRGGVGGVCSAGAARAKKETKLPGLEAKSSCESADMCDSRKLAPFPLFPNSQHAFCTPRLLFSRASRVRGESSSARFQP
jgi:hypothetical protein